MLWHVVVSLVSRQCQYWHFCGIQFSHFARTLFPLQRTFVSYRSSPSPFANTHRCRWNVFIDFEIVFCVLVVFLSIIPIFFGRVSSIVVANGVDYPIVCCERWNGNHNFNSISVLHGETENLSTRTMNGERLFSSIHECGALLENMHKHNNPIKINRICSETVARCMVGDVDSASVNDNINVSL